MKRRLDFSDLEDFDVDQYYDMPIFKGIKLLRELNVIDYKQKMDLVALLTAKFFTVETEVTQQDIVNYLKPKLRDDVSIYEVMSMIDGKAFKAEKIKKIILKNRVMSNVAKASLIMENELIKEIIKNLEDK